MGAMLRPEQLLHPQRVPVTPLEASTLLLLRDRPEGGWEVLMTRRSDQASFVPGAYVFPGGGIEAQDAQAHAQVAHRDGMAPGVLTAAIAALRESLEEMGLLLAVHADGRPATQADVDALDRHAPLWPQLAQRGLRLDVRGVWQLAHWTADRNLPKRFAVPFFVARMPDGQTPVADEAEQFEPVWIHPQQALDRHAAGQMPMIFPTLRTLARLARYPSVQAVLDAVAAGPLWASAPRSGLLRGEQHRCMEDEAPFGELAMVCPDGQILHPLDWQSERAVPLRKNLWRLTAPNANVMTGPGTNSYLVGEAATGFIAIDPGPADADHVQRLWEAAGGDVRHIVCTHSHADHSPGAFLLQALCVQQGRDKPLIHGLPSAPTARANSQFVPDVVLQDGERITLAPLGLEAEKTHNIRHTLRAVHTPGHAANHLCLLLEEDALLFSGDHILNGTTPVIDIPDGNMRDYLDSLDKLAALCAAQGVEFVLPAHGYVLGDALGVIARLKAHRLAREAKVLAAMRQQPEGSVQDWVAQAYADTPTALWKLAERSLMAHVERIRALGLLHVTD
jgi:glyoxylase-like metal-dependent hydrolase (beta-lactamase superfamily II)/8-oxo-dGTP pyrophosphatase MutT (NUDIX family)